MTSNEELRECIHKLTERINDNKRLKRVFAVVNREFVHGIGPEIQNESKYLSIITAMYSIKNPEKLDKVERLMKNMEE